MNALPVTKPPMRIAYLSGPTDAEAIFADLRSGAAASYFGTNYMRQFLIFADEIGAEALIATWNDDGKREHVQEQFTFVNLPPAQGTGMRYYSQMLRLQLAFLWRFLRFRPDVLLLTGNQDFWWVMAPLKLLGTKFVASFHGVIWPKYRPPTLQQRILRPLNEWLALRRLDAAVHTSEDIRAQLEIATGSQYARIPDFPHLPSYEERQFRDIVPPEELDRRPFRVLFMGRVERNKGVFDLGEMAAQLEGEDPGGYAFEICGNGSALDDLKRIIRDRGLNRVMTCHGYCGPDQIRSIMSKSHVVVVPTRKDFDAGFEMTCSEAILSNRPLITSAVCPALHYLRDASIEVEPEDVIGYSNAIRRLKEDADFYTLKRSACVPLQTQFFSPETSWDTAIRHAFQSLNEPRSGESAR